LFLQYIQGGHPIKEAIRQKAKELGADLIGFLNLKDYNSPRSPDPHRYLKSARSVVVLAFKPLAGAYRYQENTWSKMPSYLYSMESAGNTAAYHLGRFMENIFSFSSITIVMIAHGTAREVWKLQLNILELFDPSPTPFSNGR